jgi:hypothetical protein
MGSSWTSHPGKKSGGLKVSVKKWGHPPITATGTFLLVEIKFKYYFSNFPGVNQIMAT